MKKSTAKSYWNELSDAQKVNFIKVVPIKEGEIPTLDDLTEFLHSKWKSSISFDGRNPYSVHEQAWIFTIAELNGSIIHQKFNNVIS